jgi:hypothetical protein
MNNGAGHSEDPTTGAEIYGTCCGGTGWVTCDHANTAKDADGWCEPCGEPTHTEAGKLRKVKRWCENRSN